MLEPQGLLQVAGEGALIAFIALFGAGAALFLLGVVRAALRGAASGYIRARMRDREGHVDVPEIAKAIDELIMLGDRPRQILAILEDGRVKSFEWNRHDNTYVESDTHTLILRTDKNL